MTSTIDQIEQEAYTIDIDAAEMLILRAICEVARQLERINSGGIWKMSQADKDKKQALEQFWAKNGKRDRELSGVATGDESHDCTNTFPHCIGCPDLATCTHTDVLSEGVYREPN